MKKPDLNFDALHIEGSLLPAEFLQNLLELKAGHQTAADYDIPPGLNIKDEIGRYWRIATALWADYQVRSARPDARPDQVTLNLWLLPFFTRVLGFEQMQTVSGETIDERRFPLTHKLDNTPVLLAPHSADLDKSDPRYAPEGRRRSPQATLQEYLNASHAAQWGIVANGHTVRILRDNPSLTRPAFIEADLARIFEEERYADFVALWLLAHATRFGSGVGDETAEQPPILEQWRGQAQQLGERALANLRTGVTEALRQLGNGFLAHPANTALRQALQDQSLATEDYFKQLLRLVYRLILLITAEDRGLLHAPEASPEQRERYARGYAANRLRDRALKSRTDRHADLWQALQVTFTGLQQGAVPLGLPALGGLFDESRCAQLDAAELPNTALLRAIRALCFFKSGAVLARINYRDMDTEELGSVYESLLELQPVIQVKAHPWHFGFVGDDATGDTRGSARKLTGSYYTPDSLVQELIQSALEPKIAEALRQPDPRRALLSLKIIDPACGSGHFLLAAARRIAAEVARLDAESDIPEAVAYRHALREVVAHCIYGVDLNPLAVELCQTALWLETLEPGKPLGFLDHHIRHGNSLVGILDPGIMDEGIPDKAYIALSGDDKPACAALKKSNKKQAGGRQADLFGAVSEDTLARTLADLDALPEDSVEAIAAKRVAFQQAEADEGLARQRLKADLFCAAFFAPKTPDTIECIPLSRDLHLAATGQPLRPGVAELARELAGEYHFFHWRLAFPEVFGRAIGQGRVGDRASSEGREASGENPGPTPLHSPPAPRPYGFDVVLANPPWERIKLQEQEFFAARSPEIAGAPNAAARTRLILALKAEGASPVDQRLYRDFIMAKRGAEGASLFAHDSGRFPLTGVGDVNLYALFAESIAQLIGERGRGGVIVPTGIATDDSTKAFFDAMATGSRIASLYDFENREKLFAAVDSRMKFCALTLGRQEAARFVFFATRTDHLRDERRAFSLTGADITRLNPNTRTCPVFRSQADAELTKKIYQRVPVLIDERKGAAGNPWGISFMRMLDMANDSGLFRTAAQLLEAGAEREGANWRGTDGALWVPLYEAKMVHQFDHRWATYEDNGTDSRDMTEAEKRDPDSTAQPRYWIKQINVDDALAGRWDRQWLMGWRDITNATNERTVIAGVVPRVGTGDTFLLMFPSSDHLRNAACLLGDQNSLVHDYVARQKIGGTHLKYHVKKQIVALPPDTYGAADLAFIIPRVLELTYTAHDLRPWFEDVWNSLGDTPEGEATRDCIRAAWAESHGQPVTPGPSPLAPFPFSPDRRARLRAELDAYYARLYGLTRDELRYILDPADVHGPDYPSETFRVLKNNEIRKYGEYRTQRLVLEAWDGLETTRL